MRRFTLLSVALLTLAACGGSDPTGPEDTIPGRYNLVSLNGTALPFVLIQILEDKIEVTAGDLQLNSDGTCSSSLTTRETLDGVVTTETQTGLCSWTLNNTAIAFVWTEDGDTDSGSLIDGRVTVTSDGLVLVFEK